MFNDLTKYLFERRELILPYVGVFEVRSREASTHLSDNTIVAPGWDVLFKEEKKVPETAANEDLLVWLSARKGITKEEAGERYKIFSKEVEARLLQNETVQWEGLGTLAIEEGVVQFTPSANDFSPFSNMVAKRVERRNTDYATLVGDRQTTSSEIREELSLPDQSGRGRKSIMWISLAIALAGAAWYFTQNGCNTAATGSRQKAEVTTSGDTYKLR